MKSAFLVMSSLAALVVGPARAETELLVASYPSFDESVKLAIPRFEALHPGVKVKLVSRAFGDHHNAMITALASGVGLPDVMAVDESFLLRLVEGGGLEDLGAPPYDGKPLLQRLLPFTRPQASSGTGILAAMPADVGPGTLFYRKDLLDAAGVTEEELTRSWESYLEAGKKIKAATGAYLLANAFELEDAYLRTTVNDGESLFFGRRPGGRYPDLRGPRFARAFELAKAARDGDLDARTGVWTNEWWSGLREGTIATAMSGSWLASHLAIWIAPETDGLWRAAQLPGGRFTSWGGSFYGIPKKAAHKGEAWEFVKFMCLDRRQQLDALEKLGAWPALLSAQESRLADRPIAFLGGQPAGRLWKIAAASAPARVVGRHDPMWEDILRAELEQVLEKGKPIDQALADAISSVCILPRK